MLVLDLRIYMAVVTAGSLSAAARQLDVVPMHVSRRIAALEKEIGVRLFQRTTRSVSLTAEGEAFLPYARTMIEAEESALEELQPSASRVTGLLRVTAPSVFGQSIVLEMLPRLLLNYPELRVELDVSDTVVDMVSRGFDLALRVAPLVDSELVARQVSPNPRVLCASPKYLAQHGVPQRLSDLESHQCIVLQAVPKWPFVVNGSIIRRRMEGRVSISNVGAVRDAAVRGLGVALLAYWDVISQINDGTLVEIKLSDAGMEALSVWAVTPSRRYVPARVKVFLQMLEADMAMRSRDRAPVS
ncbi:MAG: LysR family transcriptional regulator [Candidatus Pseudomonas phytovorans]|uniref:LysR family transcriptional regulator n=1 Tax=Candidatus Pseudomonas phytovorans TaxID=3121377 RepID=A0AAJ5WGR5_9PSED|nr:LysR family transcriptional regulator [Pseudomonas sp.]WEK29368.1 MAG: LysR family transcriptional regulator [Pseudomonas sp.]